MKVFGHQLLCDLYNCDPVPCDDLNICYNFLDKAVEVIGVTKQSPPFIFRSPGTFPDKAGLSGWVPLIESSIVIHTLTVSNFISIDFYTCSTMTQPMQAALIEFAIETFKPKKIDCQFRKRGKDYFKG
jgi:S-adenosylmethionine/arginine decarboxylase-like enzyme